MVVPTRCATEPGTSQVFLSETPWRRESGQLQLRLQCSFLRVWASAELTALPPPPVSVSPLAVRDSRRAYGSSRHPWATSRRYPLPARSGNSTRRRDPPDPAGDSRRPLAPAPEAAPLDFVYPLALALTLRTLSDQRKGKCRWPLSV